MSARHDGAVGDARQRQSGLVTPKTGFRASVTPSGPAEAASQPTTGFQAPVDAQVAEIRARAEAATEGPWKRSRVFWKVGSARGLPDEWWVTVEDAAGSIIAMMPEEATDSAPNAEFIAQARADVELLLNLVADLRSRIGCVVEATYWDRPYDTRIAAIRGMCDLTTDGMTPKEAGR